MKLAEWPSSTVPTQSRNKCLVREVERLSPVPGAGLGDLLADLVIER